MTSTWMTWFLLLHARLRLGVCLSGFLPLPDCGCRACIVIGCIVIGGNYRHGYRVLVSHTMQCIVSR